jgi:hypothetical protein
MQRTSARLVLVRSAAEPLALPAGEGLFAALVLATLLLALFA